MTKYITFFLLTFASLNAKSQTLTFENIHNYQDKIFNLYSQTPKPIQDLIDALLLKGFIVSDAVVEATNINGSTRAGNTFKLENVQSGTTKEIISFSTIEVRSNTSRNLAFITRVETTDFAQYLQWVKDLRSNSNFILLAREGGQYTFRQNVNNTRLTVGPAFNLTTGGGISIKRPVTYVYEFTLSH